MQFSCFRKCKDYFAAAEEALAEVLATSLVEVLAASEEAASETLATSLVEALSEVLAETEEAGALEAAVLLEVSLPPQATRDKAKAIATVTVIIFFIVDFLL